MENNLETIYMAGQGHIFIIDLIFFWVNIPCRGVLHSVKGIFEYNWRLYSQGELAGNDHGFEHYLCMPRSCRQ